MSDNINITGLDKAAILAALYNAAISIGAGVFQYNPSPMTVQEARLVLSSGVTSFDYFHGRVLKVDLSRDIIDPRDYNRDNGPDAAERVIARLRQTGEIMSEPASDEENVVRLEARLGNVTMFEDKTK